MPKPLKLALISLFSLIHLSFFWGFFAHQKINRLAVFTLPAEMAGFYKKHIIYLQEASVNPDRRRYAVAEEAARHYIDLDEFGDSAAFKLPMYWRDAVKEFTEDTLQQRGIVPWHIYRVYFQLKDAFLEQNPGKITLLSAELGHYIADAHVPLHTTKNYDGQLTNQQGIHAFWESRLPELYFLEYDFFVGRAQYLSNVQQAAWQAIRTAHAALDSVLLFEQRLAEKFDSRKFSFESKGKQTVKVYSPVYSKAYHDLLNGMVERQMRASVKMIGDVWFTAWVDAGQPNLKALINVTPTEAELKKRADEVKQWKEERRIKSREHESDQN